MWRAFGVLHNIAAACLVVSYFLSNAAGFHSSYTRFRTRLYLASQSPPPSRPLKAAQRGAVRKLWRILALKKAQKAESEGASGVRVEEEEEEEVKLRRPSKLQVSFIGPQVFYYMVRVPSPRETGRQTLPVPFGDLHGLLHPGHRPHARLLLLPPLPNRPEQSAPRSRHSGASHEPEWGNGKRRVSEV